MKLQALLLGGLVFAWAGAAEAADKKVAINLISSDGVGKAIGSIMLKDSKDGLMISPDLMGLPPGEHGFHVHENPNCGSVEKDGKKIAGLAAGGHYDPAKAGKHMGPHKDGHLGDLPALEVAADGTAKKPVSAHRLKLETVKGRSFIIHEGGDNFSDDPKPLGGGGARIACGVID